MDAPGMCHQWCIPCSSGFRVTYTSYPSRKLGWPSRGWSSPDSRPSSYPRSVPLGQDQGHTICLSLTTLPELGGTILVHGGTRLCGLTPAACMGRIVVPVCPCVWAPYWTPLVFTQVTQKQWEGTRQSHWDTTVDSHIWRRKNSSFAYSNSFSNKHVYFECEKLHYDKRKGEGAIRVYFEHIQ